MVGEGGKALLLVALMVSCALASAPIHIFLSLTGDLSQMQLTFATLQPPPPEAYVLYYPVSLPSNVSVIEITPEETFLFVTPFNVSQYIVSVTMTGLFPALEYNYSIILNASSSSIDASYVFETLPDVDEEIDILMYGDLGAVGSALWGNVTGGLAAWASQKRMDFIIHYGDLAYNLATSNGTVGELFMQNIVNYSATFPYIVLPGNHEYMDNNTDEALYRGWFRGQVPLGQSSASPDPVMWHSYDIGEKLHLVGINAEVYCEDTEHIAAQWWWLRKDLLMVRMREQQPWIVVYGHRQMYEGTNTHFHELVMRLGIQCTDDSWTNCNASQPCLSGQNCGYSLEFLFQEYKVDMYIAGHLHSYNRMFPISSDNTYETQDNHTYINAGNPVYIISGAAGDQTPTPLLKSLKKPAPGPTPDVVTNANYSLTLLTVYNDTHLRMQQVLLNDELLDELWMIKDPSLPIWGNFTSFSLGNTTDVVCNQ